MKFVIEHLEPELWEWCELEYEHISSIVGKDNLVFTNIIHRNDAEKLKTLGTVYEKPICELGFGKILVLSQYAKKTLETNDKDVFNCVVFGGILGDNPAKKRTQTIIDSLRTSGKQFEERNLGNLQMPTDNAAYAVKKIFDGMKMNDFKFVDKMEIEINKEESVELSFRYIVDGNKPIISEKLVEYIRKNGGF